VQLTELWQQIVFGLLGGAAAELLHWYLLSRKPGGARPYSKRGVYWVTTAGMIGLGALMPMLYLSGPASALLCFHLGAATPILLQKLVSTLPNIANAQGFTGHPTMRDFFRW
jgi:hypothetical protein